MAADSPNDKRQALEALKAENAWLCVNTEQWRWTMAAISMCATTLHLTAPAPSEHGRTNHEHRTRTH